MNFIKIYNNQSVDLDSIPELDYDSFYQTVIELMQNKLNHCVNYFGTIWGKDFRLFCCIANDEEGLIYIFSTLVVKGKEYPSMTNKIFAFHGFEREIYENFGINFFDHPWLKPVRYPFNRFDSKSLIENYPFFKIDSEELHEVGVGPIHAGIIEPGHFRFLCNGEQILHLEIQLGYQHRGIEKLFVEKKRLIERAIIAENIAGDTVVGNSIAFANIWESLCDFKPTYRLINERALALEIERMAIHTGDLSAICTDIAYQLGSSVFGRLRTPIINSFQQWCGNRFAKSLIRPGKTNFPFKSDNYEWIMKVLDSFEPDFREMYECFSNLPSALSRLEKTGVVSNQTALDLGLVGMAAKASGLKRDIRQSHSQGWFTDIKHIPVVKRHGDVYSRTQIRKEEIYQSMGYIRNFIEQEIPERQQESNLGKPFSNRFAISLVEGWRGEICHCAITNNEGELINYKIKDPSFHNWMALSMAVRNNEISDFPICNKSFNLSYCGYDL